MTDNQSVIRPARADEAASLRELEIASKGHWGYDAAYLARFAAVVSMSPDFIERNEVWVLDQEGTVAGFYTLIHNPKYAVLDSLWLLPHWIGGGLGRTLFEHAVERARAAGATRLEWGAEPHALGFYERMGGRNLRDTTSELGNPIKVMGLDLVR